MTRRAKRICPKPGCPNIAQGRYCPNHNRQYEQARGTAHQRGYGHSHRKARAALVADVQRGAIACALCGLAIQPDEPWHLDHTPDRNEYRGPAHAKCNTSDGGKSAHGFT